MLSEQDTAQFKKLLEKERSLLEQQLAGLGQQNPSNPSDWVPAKPQDDQFGADRNDNADIFEDMQDSNATLNELEPRLNNVVHALERIAEGTYGVCETCKADIERERLNANPAATTCKAHMST